MFLPILNSMKLRILELKSVVFASVSPGEAVFIPRRMTWIFFDNGFPEEFWLRFILSAVL